MLDILPEHAPVIMAAGLLFLELLAIAAAVHAVMHVRTAQGAIAWLIALVTMPFIALPLYAVFGRRRFMGYVAARRAGDAAIEHVTRQWAGEGTDAVPASDVSPFRAGGFEKIAGTSFLGGNDARLLIDGAATFEAIFSALEEASHYVLAQFYIVRDDSLGERFKRHLLDCLGRGVRVYLLYDAVGSYQLGNAWIRELREAGASIQSFTGSTRRMRRLQINFRNHRKLVVVDGRSAFVGGLNVGDEYLGLDATLTPWRDTHVAVHGPVAASVQVPFVEDWYWSTGELPLVQWHPDDARGSTAVLALASGPADDREAGALMFVHAIGAARRRLWIVSPYFVPNGSIIDALKLAALRGVDVRILLPSLTDNRLVALAGYAYLPELIPSGVRVFRFTRGFLHQKVILIDDDLATVGTANLDNRSMRLNFELTLVFADRTFAGAVQSMLEADFHDAAEIDALAVADEPRWLKAAARGARLLAPVL